MKKLIIFALVTVVMFALVACTGDSKTLSDDIATPSLELNLLPSSDGVGDLAQVGANNMGYTFQMAQTKGNRMICRLGVADIPVAGITGGWIIEFGSFEVQVRPMLMGEPTPPDELRAYFISYNGGNQTDVGVKYEGNAFIFTIEIPTECDFDWDGLESIGVMECIIVGDGLSQRGEPQMFLASDAKVSVGKMGAVPEKPDWIGTYTNGSATIEISMSETGMYLIDLNGDGNRVAQSYLNVGVVSTPTTVPMAGQHEDPWKSIGEMTLQLSEDYQTITLSNLYINGNLDSKYDGEYKMQ